MTERKGLRPRIVDIARKTWGTLRKISYYQREIKPRVEKSERLLKEADGVFESSGQLGVSNELLKAAREHPHSAPRFIESEGWQSPEEEKKVGE